MAAAPASTYDATQVAALEAQLAAAKALLLAKTRADKLTAARKRFKPFCELMLPDPERPDDPDASEYDPAPHTALLRDIVEGVVYGRKNRVGVSIPPQHGKTMHLSTLGPAFIWVINPRAKIIIATYNEDRAGDLGDEFKAAITSPAFRQIAPEIILSASSKGKHQMRNTLGGRITFVGKGGAITGKTADYFFIDDPFKGEEDSGSEAEREKLWKWFFAVAYSRGSNKTRMLIVHTRWHEDDLLGRLCDASHPERKKRFANVGADWTYLNVPGVVTDPDLAKALKIKLVVQTDPAVRKAFGDKPMAALWEKDKNLKHFTPWKNGDSRSFNALVMGKPSPEDGAYFLRSWIREYAPAEMPDNLNWYSASDHANSEKKKRDYTVIGSVGVDAAGGIWLPPNLTWDRMETDKTVKEIIAEMKLRKPFLWWMEDENISRSFGPFLRERMRDEQIYVTLVPVRPSADKMTRARAIQGRMSLGTVYFPAGARWLEDAKTQLLQFPYGAHDDFVDWLSLIGLGLGALLRAEDPETVTTNLAEPGSISWILRATEVRARAEKAMKAREGW